MIKVVQFGEGNFLRTFVCAYFDTLCDEGKKYEVNIVKPIPFGNLDAFKKQNNRYHIVLRGMENGKPTEKVKKINVLKNVIDPFSDTESFYAFARDPELKIIVSNTTEAGICFSDKDSFDGFDGITYPAKLIKFLHERFTAGLDGVYLLPVELIENNADELKKCVDLYISLWGLSDKFKAWNDTQNYYCNTLVDRIVSGHPKDEATLSHLTELIGEADALSSVGEPFGLWAVEKKGEIAKYIPEGRHNIDVVLTENIGYYKKRKVRVLNGSHTNLVAAGLLLGKETVYDCMTDEKILAFVDATLKDEIIPFVSDDIKATTEFAEDVKERFFNPFLNHQLTSIALNSVSKWRARNLISFRDYYDKNGRIPKNLTVGFSYLMALYARVRRSGDTYTADVPGRTIEIKDEKAYLDYFADGGSVTEFMKKEDVFGEDLTKYVGFAEAVEANIKAINEGTVLL